MDYSGAARIGNGSSSDEDEGAKCSLASSGNSKAINNLQLFHIKGQQIYSLQLPELKEGEFHTVLFKISHGEKQKIIYPDKEDDFIFKDHAYLPNSSKEHHDSETPRWKKIADTLKKNISSVFELEELILSYNQLCIRTWNFDALLNFMLQLNEEKRNMFFVEILPNMQKLALKLPYLFKKPVPLLKQGESRKITMTQEQAACLLANAFFCTFPKRSYQVRGSKMPDINFSNLFCDEHSERNQEKLKCIFNYFQRVTKQMAEGTLTFTRQSFKFKDLPDWKCSKHLFTKLYVSDTCTVENDGKYMLQANFTNKYVGQEEIRHGLVLEEIGFICPEMMVAPLFTECLLDTEVLIVTGSEIFSSCQGYSETLKFEEDYQDDTERDNWGRRYTEVVFMADPVIENYEDQFDTAQVLRELNKAYCAFSGKYKQEEYGAQNLDLPAVCIVNWGYGDYGGDKQLKALIQLMAAAVAQRDVCYFTYGDKELECQLREVHAVLQRSKLHVRNIFDIIELYHREKSFSSSSNKTFFNYLLKCII